VIDGKNYRLQLERAEAGWQCRINDRELEVNAVLTRRNVLSLLIGGKAYEVKLESTSSDLHIWVGSDRYQAELRDPRSLRSRRDGAASDKGPQKLVASMPGKVVRVLVREKMEVKAGQGIVVVEAMKMQNEIKSPKDGIVEKLLALPGDNVNAGDVLAIVG
jgi:biotin carboxyl carrier protein